ncbi:hybrid non-ribosomal peptide synthetase/type I polyketide synthase [Pelosinus fermentans]|uniref:Amino acid adenylation domain protein n=1 Tax=Pelosinus fermentans JBW45 TaxID=1192197 RepID=I9NKW1_9FIRM|nr:hybrid non-ribosomal peptide synthetase/type I polyketide synthase [Pelosinus fermentans]AJQ28946.1 amino acid adenylation domain protein [Pelosinus fermentans JBW45]
MMHTETTAKSQIIKKALIEIQRLKQELNAQQNVHCEPVAVIGMACRFPGGITDSEKFWEIMVEMKDMICSIPDTRWKKYHGKNILDNPYIRKAGFLSEDIEAFDHRLFRLSPKEAERMDPQQRIFLKVCWEALENSGYAPDKLKGSKTGVYAGVTLPDYINELYLDKKINASLEPGDVTGSGFSFLSGRVSYFFGFQGPGITVDTACSSSLVSVDQACKGLMTGDCDMAIAGGVNLLYSPETTELLSTLNILSPDCVIRSFDAKANGTVRGEGCGVVVLKKLSAAVRDGDHIHAVIRGSGVNQDGLSSGLTAPYGPAQEKLITDVWQRCKLDPRDIGYLEAHGTGTELGDPIEISALGNVLAKDRITPLYVGTVKTNIGHLEAAAGIAGLIKAVLAVENGKIPGNLHFETPSPHINWQNIHVEVPRKTLLWENSMDKPRIAGVNSFGLSGTNAHVVVEQYCNKSPRERGNSLLCDKEKVLPFKFSSITERGLRDQLEGFLTYLEKIAKRADISFPDLSYSQNIAKADLKERIVVWAKSAEELKTNIKQALAGRTNLDVSRKNTDKKVIFLFTGQGSQYPAMFADFYRENRIFRSCLDQCNTYYKENTGKDLIEIIFSSGSFLHETRYTQPALFAVEYSLAQMWLEYGVEPAFMMGHSVGEYTAACLAGVFDLADAVKLITARGELMYSLPQNGKMAAVLTGKKIVQNIMKDKKSVSIAAANTPEQTVISGDEKEVKDVCAALENDGIKTVPLQVSHAFHSPLMEPIVARFEAVARQVKYFVPSKVLISNVTGSQIGAGIASWEYWSRHIPAEVRFYESVKSIENPEEYVFLEIGPFPVLTSMVECICGDKADCIASNYPDVKTADQIEKSVFHLYNRGVNIEWKKYYAEAGCKKVAIPNYRFSEKHFGLAGLNGEHWFLTQHDQVDSPGGLDLSVFPGDPLSGQAFSNPDEVKKYIRAALIRELKTAEDELLDDQNLLLYGLNSIVTTRLVASWKSDLAVPLNPGIFLSNCTINKWTEIICEKMRNQETGFEEKIPFHSYPDKSYEPFPLNEVQYAYWAGRNAELEWGGVGCYASFEIDANELDPARFEQALHALLQRHEMLRNIISVDGTQQIMPEIKPPLTVYHREAVPDLQTHLEVVRGEISTQVIPLGTPMFDIRLTEMNEGQWRIHFGIDFMIADALSLFIFWKDLACLYSGGRLPVLEVSYKDYLSYTFERKKGRQYELDKKYWLDRAEGFPAAPEFPVNLSGGQAVKRKFVRRKKLLDRETWLSFVQAAAGQNLTPSAALLSLYVEILSAWGAGSHFALMLTVFDREDVHPQINQIIGDFTQLMLVEIRRDNIAAALNAAAIQSQMQADIEHSNYSAIDFVKELNKRDDAQERMYPVVFTSALGMENLNDNAGLGGFLDNMGWSVSSTPQVWLDHQVYNEKGGVTLSWDALDDVFQPDVVNSMFEKYVELVMRAARGQNFWSETVVDLRTERQRQTHENANSTVREFKDTLLHEIIRHRAFTDADQTAVVFDNQQYSYQQLIARANQVSQLLQEQGVKKGDRVALQMGKSFEQIAVVLGIVQAGAAYVPLSCDQPASRTLDILRKAEITILFVDHALSLGEEAVKQLISLELEGKDGVWHEVEISPSDLAYIIYTSGSTGTPKGVCISHHAAMNTIIDVNSRLGVTAADRILGVSALSFDLSVYDTFGVLTAGGALILPTEAERMDPKCWRRLALEHHITLWNSVPALMDIYADFLGGGNSGKDTCIRQIILSGDWIPLGLFDKIKQALPNAQLTAMGGATEASIWSNYYHVTGIEPEWRSVPYGYPLANQSFHILDEFGRPCPDWVKGKLHIAGQGLANGYLNEPGLTNKAFFQHAALKQRLYDTGDYGRYMQNGVIEFLGRQDNQFKINGYRIEAGEIQSAFGKCGITGDPVILPVGDRMESKKLIAYVKGDPASFSESDLKNSLKAYLPSYFIPERIIAVKDFPMTFNGKVDRQKLLENLGDLTKQATSSAYYGIAEYHPVLQTVREILNLPELKPADNFGDMGVSSVDIIRLANHLETVYADRPSVGEMVRYRSVSDLIDFYRQKNIGLADKNAKQLVPDARFCMFSQEQIKYLSKIEPITNPDEREYFRKAISAQRSELLANERIPLEFDELSLKKDHCFWHKSDQEFLPAQIDQISFKQFLALCLQETAHKDKKFNYGSAGGIYPVQIYLSVFKNGIEGIAEGSYYLDVREHSLVQLHRHEMLSPGSPASGCGGLKNAAFLIHFVGDLNVVYPIHERNSLKLCFIETGLICQLLETHAGLFDIGCRQVGAYEFEKKHVLFDLTAQHYYLHSMAAGKIDFRREKAKMIADLSASATDNFREMEMLTEKCRAQEIHLRLEGDRLKFKAPAGTMTQEIQAELKANKEGLIRYLRETPGQTGSDFSLQVNRAFRLTPIQLAYVLGRSPDYQLGNTSAHYYAEFECSSINPVQLENAVNEVIRKHEMLRTVIYDNGTQQVLQGNPRFKIPVHHIDDKRKLEEIRSEWSHHRYELGKWPMFHVQISQLDDNISRLHFSFDCLIVDGWSAEMMFREIFRAYYGKAVTQPDFTFREYINQEENWLKAKSYHKEAGLYWEERLHNIPPAPELPLKKNFDEIVQPRFRRLQFVLSSEDSRTLGERIKKYRFTPSAVICTAYMKVLSCWSSRKDITLNLTLFNRLPLNKDVPRILGDFTNITLIAFFYNSGSSFVQETGDIQNQLWKAVEYRTHNGLDLLRRLAKDSPGKAVMPVVFTSLLFGESSETAEQIFLPDMKEVYAISQTPQVAIDHQAYERNGSLSLIWDFVEEAFEDSVIEGMFAAYRSLIERLIAEEDWNKVFTVRSSDV